MGYEIVKPRWVALEGDELEDYLNARIAPLWVRETEHGVEVYDPHEWSIGSGLGMWRKICRRCDLIPFDYDSIEYECVTGSEPDEEGD